MLEEFLSQPGGWIGVFSFVSYVCGTGINPSMGIYSMMAAVALVSAVSIRWFCNVLSA